MIERNAGGALSDLARQYPVLTVTGPRQSGKTTLVEAKSGATVADDFFDGLDALAARVAGVEPGRAIRKILVGDEHNRSGGTQIVPWAQVPSVDWGDDPIKPSV